MSAFKDSGHHWWQECQLCGMAWFVGDEPDHSRDSEATCQRCEADAAKEVEQ
jgi:uncharacterized paraquat-inducible protein A